MATLYKMWILYATFISLLALDVWAIP